MVRKGYPQDLIQAVRPWPTPQAHDKTKGNATRVGRYGTKDRRAE